MPIPSSLLHDYDPYWDGDFTRCILCGCPTVTPSPVWLDVCTRPPAQSSSPAYAPSGTATAWKQDHANIQLSTFGVTGRTRGAIGGIINIPAARGLFSMSAAGDLRRGLWGWVGAAAGARGRRWRDFSMCLGCCRRRRLLMEVELIQCMYNTEPVFASPNDYYPCISPSIEELLQGEGASPAPVPAPGPVSVSVSISSTRSPPGSRAEPCMGMAGLNNPTDPFSRLPLELREQIACALTTQDYLSLRSASRAMGVVFSDNHFWKTRFFDGGDREFLGFLLCSNGAGGGKSGHGNKVDWRQLYHASALGKRLDTTIRAWTVLRWIKDVLVAEDTLAPPPLDFYGAALQDHPCSTPITHAKGQRVEKAPISYGLKTIGISIVSLPDAPVYTQQHSCGVWKSPESSTTITALEFIYRNGTRTLLGSIPARAKTLTADELTTRITQYHRYRRYKNFQNVKVRKTRCPFDEAGVHVLCDARAVSFRGFTIRYDESGIYAIGLINRDSKKDHATRAMDRGVVFGYGHAEARVFDMALEKVGCVVGTFEGSKLVDLGLRGRGIRAPLHGLSPYIEGDAVDYLRYGEGGKKKVELLRLEDGVAQEDQVLGKRRRSERLKSTSG
ncbi:uncharacterized protein DSM5745_07856 [Aspergillus mulundensis]|uniref:F-box domain-containing protein n=1 Tax=Aspergillus mulundensis TaxID=1810919 RepID=A0A3D8RFN4_9EURO|nr:hypothetical protein DSM5745_07856 [Aspergillus mulundensis]RDW72684.1 hypothetical protein DSM5745_07856 [Aspergillus mulundensis]